MLIDNPESFGEVLDWFNRQEMVGIDTETNGLYPFRGNRLVGISLAGLDGNAFYLPFRHGMGTNLPKECLDTFIRAMNMHKTRLIFWNAKFDLHMFYVDGFKFPKIADPGQVGLVEDAMVAAHLVNENESNYQLKSTADRYNIGRGSLDEEELMAVVTGQFRCTNGHGPQEKCDPSCKKLTTKSWKGQMWRLDPKTVAAYAETDALLTLALRQFYMPHLQTWKLENLYREQCEYLMILTDMEVTGIQLDVELIKEYIAEATEKRDALLDYFRRITRMPAFNPGSWQQLQKAFGWKTTREEYLLELKELGDPNASKVIEYRAWEKVMSTYYLVWLETMDEQQRLRTNMNIIGTYTGRLSSREPNLQAIPKYTDIYKVKDVVVATSPEMTLIEIDIAGAELRLACHYSGEHVMGELLAKNEDIHTATAVALNVERKIAKTINFCLHPDTLVDTPEGNRRISEMRPGDKVWAMHDHNREIRVGTVVRSAEQQMMEAFKITFDNGESVIASENHKWPVRRQNGKIWQFIDVLTNELRVGERMYPIRRHVRKSDGRTQIYTTSFTQNLRMQSHLVCEAYNGPRPEGEEAHHINLDRSDDRPQNLEWKNGAQHRIDHNSVDKVQITCKSCGKNYQSLESRNLEYCSRECSWQGLHKQTERICPVCDTKFYRKASKKQTYCSPQCYINRNYINHRIVSIEPVGTQPMWSIETDGDHNYFLAAGVLTRNSAVYGIGANKFSVTYKHTLEDSKRYLSAYHNRYKGFKRLYYKMQEYAEKFGYIRLDTGRIRRYAINGKPIYGAEVHKASSNFIQGTVGEVMRIAMYRIAKAMEGTRAKILLTVHDSLLLEVPKNEAMMWACLAARAMTDFAFDPPLNVECKMGDRWGKMEVIELPEWATWNPSKYLPGRLKPEGHPEGLCWWIEYAA